MLDLFPTVSVSEDVLPFMRDRPPWAPVNSADQARTKVLKQLVPGPPEAPEVAISIYRPNDCEGNIPCIFHIHGGGYVTGSAGDLEGVHLPLAADLNCCIISVDYRLAPETVFPGAIEDSYAAIAWVFRHAEELRIDAARVGVMGESAGGSSGRARVACPRPGRIPAGVSASHLSNDRRQDMHNRRPASTHG